MTGLFDFSPDSDPLSLPPDLQMTLPTWAPLPGRQTAAYESRADVIGYGGSAGGGKSLLGIGLSITRHRRSLILRREAVQARDLWRELVTYCAGRGRLNETTHTVRDLPGGRMVELAGLKNPNDWIKYAGRPFDLYHFDEATEFTEAQVRSLIAWNRTDDPEQQCQVLLTFNPPRSPDGLWIVDYFAPWLDERHPDPADPGALRWFVRSDDGDLEVPGPAPVEHKGELLIPRSRTFIPALLSDNPILEATGYRTVLQALPEPLRSQLLYGDMRVGTADDAWQLLPTAWVRAAQSRWRVDGRPRAKDGQPLPWQVIGMDVAQGGVSRSVLARRCLSWFAEPEIHPGVMTPDAKSSADLLLAALDGGGLGLVDVDGVGAGTYGNASARLPGRVGAYQGSASMLHASDAVDRTGQLRFLNLRAFAWYRFREELDPQYGSQVALPPGRGILAELCAPRYEIRAQGVVKIEEKADIVRRLGRSLDVGDALVIAALSPRPTRAQPLRGTLGGR